jgi:DNA (cytosine-5)-methyltransferase 1
MTTHATALNAFSLVAHALTTRPDAPWLLDLYCGAGGAAMGYWQAGFNVLGVDIAPQKRYPFWFVQADALEFAREYGGLFDAIHASPPCQRYSECTPLEYKANHPDLIKSTQDTLQALGKPFVIENVPGARYLLTNPLMICGTAVGLPFIQRHRYFELGNGFEILLTPPCQHIELPVLITGTTRRKTGRFEYDVQACRDASGIDWMTRSELDEAIPPAYTKYIGEQLMRHVRQSTARAPQQEAA